MNRFAALSLSTLMIAGCGGSVQTVSSDSGTTQDATTPDAGRDGSVPSDGSGSDTMRLPDVAHPDGCLVGPPEAGFDAGPPDAAVIGTPCVPSQESSATFDGFDSSEIELEPVPVKSGAPTCLVDHFQGLVTCPYGQSATGEAPGCASPCTTSSGAPVTGEVQPQCSNRLASKVVLWSCRCANPEGKTDDGDTYCACPAGLACTQLISSIGDAGANFAGGYCASSAETSGMESCGATCNPSMTPCP
jgi:hypothetical protein